MRNARIPKHLSYITNTETPKVLSIIKISMIYEQPWLYLQGHVQRESCYSAQVQGISFKLILATSNAVSNCESVSLGISSVLKKEEREEEEGERQKKKKKGTLVWAI